jgi:hypothetical protein
MTPAPTEGGPTAVVFDQEVNILFVCPSGHRHEVAKGHKYNRGPWPAGEPFTFEAESCALAFLDAFGPRPGSAGVTAGAANSGRISGLRLA